MSHLARLSLANRSLVALATVAVLIVGVFAAGSLKQQLLPSQTLPSIVIVTSYQGASPEIVEREVTTPIEEAVQGGPEVQEITSTSEQGNSTVQLAYNFGVDTEEKVQQLQEEVNRVQLPEDVDPTVRTGSFSDFPVVMLAATSPQGQQQLATALEQQVAPELQSITGVSQVDVTGVRERKVRVTLDRDKLATHGLTTQQVNNALQASDSPTPGGTVTGGGETLAIEAGDAFTSVEQIENFPLSVSAAATGTAPAQRPSGGQAGGPQPVQLGEVSAVELVTAKASALTRTNGKPSLGISITKTQDGNTVHVSEQVRSKLSDLERQLAGGAELAIIFDQAPFIQDSIQGLTTEGLLGLAFAVLVILVFLLSVRSTLVTAVSIPLSVLIAMVGLWVGDFSLNLLTLGGLTIAIGRVVDDSIVVLENIKRHLGYGEQKRQAILTGVREVAGAVTSSTLTAVAVFLPIAFVGGIVGQMFGPFSLAVTIALLASLLVSLTIIPVLAYWFLRAPSHPGADAERVRAEAEQRELRNPLQRFYVPTIHWVTGHKAVTLGLAFALFAGSMMLVPQLQTNFLGQAGRNTFTLSQELTPATSLQATSKAAEKVEGVLDDLSAVENYQVTVGSGGGFAAFFGGGASTNTASHSVTIESEADRDEVIADVRNQVHQLQDAGEVTVSSSSGGASSSNLEVVVTAPDGETLREAATEVRKAVAAIPETTETASNLSADVPQLAVDVDEQAAADNGLTQTQIAEAVRTVTQGVPAAEITLDGERKDIELTVDDSSGTDPQDVAKLEIPTAGEAVQLDDIADVSRTEAPVQITHTGGERSASITATATAENVGAVNADLRGELQDLDLPEGADYELAGVTSDQRQAFQDLGTALLAAILVAYLIMVATFRSLLQPLVLLVSVPFAATGTVALLLATGTPLGVSALIGALMLVGIVVTNAIVLLDLINQYRAQGLDARTATVEGSRHRLRPVLMTAVATICALTPMALGITGHGAFVSQPLAITVIGGLTTSTVLTLILVPALYAAVEGAKERWRASRSGRHSRSGVSAEEDQLIETLRDLPDEAREEFVSVMGGVARELGDAHGQRRLPSAPNGDG